MCFPKTVFSSVVHCNTPKVMFPFSARLEIGAREETMFDSIWIIFNYLGLVVCNVEGIWIGRCCNERPLCAPPFQLQLHGWVLPRSAVHDVGYLGVLYAQNFPAELS